MKKGNGTISGKVEKECAVKLWASCQQCAAATKMLARVPKAIAGLTPIVLFKR